MNGNEETAREAGGAILLELLRHEDPTPAQLAAAEGIAAVMIHILRTPRE